MNLEKGDGFQVEKDVSGGKQHVHRLERQARRGGLGAVRGSLEAGEDALALGPGHRPQVPLKSISSRGMCSKRGSSSTVCQNAGSRLPS